MPEGGDCGLLGDDARVQKGDAERFETRTPPREVN